MTAVKLAVIGAGARVQRYYGPILTALAQRGLFTVVGLASRSPGPVQARAAETGWRAVASLDELLALAPEAALLAVPPEAKEPLASRLLARGLHLFLESPASPRPRTAFALAAEAGRRGRVVEVAEEQAFSPEADLQREVAASGVLGRLVAVVNDRQEYYHHACARLHRLLGGLDARSIGGRNLRLADGAAVEQREIRMNDGTWYAHTYARPKAHPVRLEAGWQVVCERGVVTETGAHWRADDGTAAASPFEPQSSALHAEVRGRRFSWTDPYAQPAWNRQHHGLARLLTGFAAAIRGQGAPLHGIQRAAQDLELSAAMELAARVVVGPLPAWLARGLVGWR